MPAGSALNYLFNFGEMLSQNIVKGKAHMAKRINTDQFKVQKKRKKYIYRTQIFWYLIIVITICFNYWARILLLLLLPLKHTSDDSYCRKERASFLFCMLLAVHIQDKRDCGWAKLKLQKNNGSDSTREFSAMFKRTASFSMHREKEIWW